MRHIAAISLVLAATPVLAQEWAPLPSAEALAELLIAHDLLYEDGATQEFRDSGRTLYTFGEPSWGYWRIESGLYCSRWPPGDTWDCYAVDYDGEASVRFTDEWGNVSIGVFME